MDAPVSDADRDVDESPVSDALVLCGGKGTRLGSDVEKPLVEVCGTPMVDRVLDALAASRVDRVHAVVSPHAPDTRAHVKSETAITVSVVDAPGDGYVEDLEYALDRVGRPALTAAADLPLLAPSVVDRVLDVVGTAPRSLAVCVPAALKRRLGASVDTTFVDAGHELAPTGLNVVAHEDDALYVSYDARLAVNVNWPADVDLASALCLDRDV